MPFHDSDIDIFFTDFAVDAVWTPSGGTASTIKVIFDNDYKIIVDNVEGSGPAVTCKTASVPDIRHDDELTVNSTAYKVINIQHDGNGVTTLLLAEIEEI